MYVFLFAKKKKILAPHCSSPALDGNTATARPDSNWSSLGAAASLDTSAAYTVPVCTSDAGTVVELPVTGENRTWSPLNHATNVLPVLDADVVIETLEPAAGAMGDSIRPGSALIGSAGFDDGQLLMNWTTEERVSQSWTSSKRVKSCLPASEYTPEKPSGVWYAVPQAAPCWTAEPTQASCSASTARIDAAASR